MPGTVVPCCVSCSRAWDNMAATCSIIVSGLWPVSATSSQWRAMTSPVRSVTDRSSDAPLISRPMPAAVRGAGRRPVLGLPTLPDRSGSSSVSSPREHSSATRVETVALDSPVSRARRVRDRAGLIWRWRRMSDMFEMRTSAWALGLCVPGPPRVPQRSGPPAGIHPAAGTSVPSSIGVPVGPADRGRAPQRSDSRREGRGFGCVPCLFR